MIAKIKIYFLHRKLNKKRERRFKELHGSNFVKRLRRVVNACEVYNANPTNPKVRTTSDSIIDVQLNIAKTKYYNLY